MRRLEVLATGLPLFGGVPLAVDATVVSALHANGTAWSRAHECAGTALDRAHDKKSDVYSDVETSSVVRLTTLACEVGGRWSEQCQNVIEQLAYARSREAPHFLQVAAKHAYASRWWALLSCAQQDAVAATLIQDGVVLFDRCDSPLSDITDLLSDRLLC